MNHHEKSAIHACTVLFAAVLVVISFGHLAPREWLKWLFLALGLACELYALGKVFALLNELARKRGEPTFFEALASAAGHREARSLTARFHASATLSGTLSATYSHGSDWTSEQRLDSLVEQINRIEAQLADGKKATADLRRELTILGKKAAADVQDLSEKLDREKTDPEHYVSFAVALCGLVLSSLSEPIARLF